MVLCGFAQHSRESRVAVAAQRAIGETHISTVTSYARTDRFSRYWSVSRSLMLLWLGLSLWQIGVYPLTDGDAEARGILLGFRLASAVDDPVALGTPFLYGVPPFSYLLAAISAHMLPAVEFMWRLPYALVGAMQMPLILLLTERFFGRRSSAFAGVLMLGTGLFALNRLTTGDSVFIVCELAGAFLLLKYIDEGTRRWLILAVLSFVAAALTESAGVAFLFAALAVVWLAQRNRRDIVFASVAGFGPLIAYHVVSRIVSVIFANNRSLIALPELSSSTTARPGIQLTGFMDSWLVYAGVPVLALVLVGLAEAFIRREWHRKAILAVIGLSAVFAVPWLVMGPVEEQPILVLPMWIVVAGYGWAQVTHHLHSVAAQGMVAMSVVSVVLAGVVWQQAVFNPATRFTDALLGLRDYALSLEHGPGLFEDDGYGIKAVAQVLREETDPGDRVFVRADVSAAAVSLYSARSVEVFDFADFNDGVEFPDQAFLVIRGEDETFNGGLSGTTSVVANHRIFVDDRVLYQVVKFDSSGEPFQTPVWWRAEPHIRQFADEHTDFRDFLTPLRPPQ
jgi:hypothetical protein